MGSLNAQGFADAVNDGLASIDTALSWHLTSNHYPPLPTFFISTCKAAIEAGNDEDWDREIKLPRGCATHQRPVADDWTQEVCPETGTVGKGECRITNIVEWKDGRDVVRAGDLIESFHLDSFINCYDEDEDDDEL
jgi:hypothetical protein